MKSSGAAIPSAAPMPRAGSVNCSCRGCEFPARSRRSVRRRPDQPRSAHRNCRARRSGRTAVAARQRAARPGRATRARGRDCDRRPAAAPLARHRRAGADRNRAHEGPGPSAGDVGAADAFARSHRRHRAPRRPRGGQARRRQCRRAFRNGYSALIKRAGQDGVLTLKVGQRDDLSDQQLKDLLAGSIDIVRRRLFEVVKPDGRPRSSRR
jgi:hypothetical protein